MLNERFGISHMSEGNENAIWQCPEIFTCQTLVRLKDNRTDEVEDFNVFFTFTENDDPRSELDRIVNQLGFTNCGVISQSFRKCVMDSFSMHQAGKPLEG